MTHLFSDTSVQKSEVFCVYVHTHFWVWKIYADMWIVAQKCWPKPNSMVLRLNGKGLYSLYYCTHSLWNPFAILEEDKNNTICWHIYIEQMYFYCVKQYLNNIVENFYKLKLRHVLIYQLLKYL